MADQPFTIGEAYLNGLSSQFTGSMKNARVYTCSLSADTINTIAEDPSWNDGVGIRS
ncbi:MAG: hypothetical protein ISS28_07085 [Candidatus Cloacimonetes bacterium]|nr:hypothetical protein [Actinomycetota bacterium]MBL7086840.1 hypothetical protein [Candidatus Cloacimonadota bacterium]